MSLFEFDKAELLNSKASFLIGTDEAGRGPAAGGVWAGAVCFKRNINLDEFSKLNDSKKLKPKTRELLYELIKSNSYCAIKAVSVEKIEQINILQASLLAMRYAIIDVMEQIYKDLYLSNCACSCADKNLSLCAENRSNCSFGFCEDKHGTDLPLLEPSSTLVLVDGNKLIKDFNFNQKFVIKGDSKSATIAAASILAKVSRDRYMDKLHEKHPQYDWINNKGYLTKKHIEALQKYGATKYHRLSFLKNVLETPDPLSL